MPRIRLRNKWAIVAGLCFSVPLVIAGCSKKEQPAPKPAPSPSKPAVSAKPVQKQQSSAVAVVTLPQLDFVNRKDPFKPFIVQQEAAQKAPERRAKSADALPIQSYDVTKFKVAGIIAGLKENKALVLDPTGKGYVVKQGMLIGNNDGYISKITSSGIEVIESYREDTGRLRKRTIRLTPLKGKETSR